MKVKGRTYTYVINKAEEGGYVAKCIELPQVHTEGETLTEVKKNMRDALTLAVGYLREGEEGEGRSAGDHHKESLRNRNWRDVVKALGKLGFMAKRQSVRKPLDP